MNVILPSAGDINTLMGLIDVLSDPKKSKASLTALKDAVDELKAQQEAMASSVLAAEKRKKEVQGVIDGLADREKAVAARETEVTAKEEKLPKLEADLKARVEEFENVTTKDLPKRLSEADKREKAVAKREKELAKLEEKLAADLEAAAVLKVEYEGKLAQFKALAG